MSTPISNFFEFFATAVFGRFQTLPECPCVTTHPQQTRRSRARARAIYGLLRVIPQAAAGHPAMPGFAGFTGSIRDALSAVPRSFVDWPALYAPGRRCKRSAQCGSSDESSRSLPAAVIHTCPQTGEKRVPRAEPHSRPIDVAWGSQSRRPLASAAARTERSAVEEAGFVDFGRHDRQLSDNEQTRGSGRGRSRPP